ncbi:MAG TPA: hypothetical protein VEW04_04930 [Allosphingosinicella sp.]|nr:hypothetical protein [Allosphingosinicella sp.]
MADHDANNLKPDVDEAAVGRKAAQQSFRKGGSRDPKVFVLLRELSEVHLLLDNVSANPNTTVSERTTEEKLKQQGLANDWIEKVCEISWPPDGSNEEKAEDAALLIRAKDYLNRLSAPASGSTIAFTLLVTQGDAKPRRSKLASLWRRLEEEEVAGHRPPTRRSLAEAAYPDLIEKATGFRRAIWWISVSLVFALLLTCTISWYVAYGNAALAELASARTAVATAQERVDEAETGDNDDGGGAPDQAPRTIASTARASTQPAGGGAASTPQFIGLCANKPYQAAAQSHLCNARDHALAEQQQVERRLADWLCWDRFDDCSNPAKLRDAASRAAATASIIGTAVLPFLYGLLGAGAAIIRSLSRKIRASLLSPRDLHLSFQQLALGAVIGACIGLFVSAPGGDGESILGPVTLSASAISFVAGFGVEAVFQAIEALITRIFNLTSATPTGNRGDGVAS